MWDSHSDLAVIPADGEFSDLGIGGFAAAAAEASAGRLSADGDQGATDFAAEARLDAVISRDQGRQEPD